MVKIGHIEYEYVGSDGLEWNGRMEEGICEGCHRRGKLVLHHWFQYDSPPSTIFSKYICYVCNAQFRTSNFEVGNHYLPPWEIQQIRLQNIIRLDEYLTNISK